VQLSASDEKASRSAAVILVPCAETDRAGCQIVRRAVELVAAEAPEVSVAAPEDCERGTRAFVVAIDASQSCQASADLRENGIRTSAVISAPEVLAKLGLLRLGVDPRRRMEELAQALAEGIRQSLDQVLEEARERRRYREEMAPVIQRFQGIWGKLETLAPPNGMPAEKESAAVELLAKRARNLFTKFDEVVPPVEWSDPHDLFQDALLCIAYACEGWIAGDLERWEQNIEKARVQLQPLMRRLR
jgi:hypothetical protein